MAETESLRVGTVGDTRHPPLVFLHGFLGDSRDWDDIIPAFSDRYLCLVPDLPGHGGSPFPESLSEPGFDYAAERCSISWNDSVRDQSA